MFAHIDGQLFPLQISSDNTGVESSFYKDKFLIHSLLLKKSVAKLFNSFYYPTGHLRQGKRV